MTASDTVQPDDVHSLGLMDAALHVTRTDPAFALTTAIVRGQTYPVFANAPRHVPDLFHRARAAHDDGVGTLLVYEGERMTFDAAAARVAALARALVERFGVASGDRVALVSRNYPEMLIALLAISAAGGVAVLLNAWWTTDELRYGVTDSGARVALADGPRLALLRPLAKDLDLSLIGLRDGEEQGDHGYAALCAAFDGATVPDVAIDPDADFAIMYSSGTTGAPKGVIQTHRGVVNAVWTWLIQPRLKRYTLHPGDPLPVAVKPSYLIVTPLFHVTALYPLAMLGVAAGARITLMHKWDAARAADILRAEAVTRFIGVPTQTADLTDHVADSGQTFPRLAYLGSGGAKRPAAHVARLAATFPASGIATGWGMTETCALGIGMIGADYTARPDAAGRPYPPLQAVRVCDDAGRALPPGATGELEVRSVANMRGYHNRPDATAEVLRDGWLATGDLASIDADGFVTLHDRKKNIVIRGGENVSCAEVEEALHRHPDVVEACAFAIPHARLGEVVGAALHLRAGADLDHPAVTAFLDGRLARFKMPERVWTQHVPLPRGTTDKTDARAVKRACLQGP